MRNPFEWLIFFFFLGACDEILIERCRDTVCPLGQRCAEDSGQCVPGEDRCAGVVCAEGYRCDPEDGQCRGGPTDLCLRVLCADHQSCDPASGTCVDNPPPPTLPPMIVDRVGRPGISTLLLNPFGLVPVSMMPEPVEVSWGKYNSAAMPTAWVGTFAPYLRFNLGIFDGLDGVCGNQYLAGPLNANRYANLANLLANDVLHLNTGSASCTAFFAAEVNADDCGGRRPGYDVVDTLYTLLITGSVITPVGDGVGPTVELMDSFPYLAPAK